MGLGGLNGFISKENRERRTEDVTSGGERARGGHEQGVAETGLTFLSPLCHHESIQIGHG